MYLIYEMLAIAIPGESYGLLYSGVIRADDANDGWREVRKEFEHRCDAQLGDDNMVRCGTRNVRSFTTKHEADTFLDRQKKLKRQKQECGDCIFTNWTPGTELRVELPQPEPLAASPEDGAEDAAGAVEGDALAAKRALAKWMFRNDIFPKESAAATLALIVQTALALQGFDPGPQDGLIGRRTIAAIMAWRAVAGLSEGASFADVLAGIIRAAFVLDGQDPGAASELLGPRFAFIHVANEWERQYEGNLSDTSAPTKRLEPGTDCIEPLWEGGWLRFRNNCSVGVDVNFRTESPDDHLGCASRPPNTKYPCSTYVAAGENQAQLQTIWGDGPMNVYWVACKSPDGIVAPFEKGYGKVVCE